MWGQVGTISPQTVTLMERPQAEPSPDPSFLPREETREVSMPGVDLCTAPGDHKLEASSIGPSTCTKPTEN